MSPVLEFQTIRFGEGNDLPYAMFLPSYAATAHYHDALPEKWQTRPVEDVIAEARRSRWTTTCPRCSAARAWTKPSRNRVRTTLSELTGLGTQYLEDAGLRHQPGPLQQGVAPAPAQDRGPPGRPLPGHRRRPRR